MSNTLKFGNGEWYGKKDTILAYNDLNRNFKPLPFNFSRESSATVVNKDGLIETVGAGMPRIDYKDDTKGALKLEPSRTNLITYSSDFPNPYWTKSGVTIQGNPSTTGGELVKNGDFATDSDWSKGTGWTISGGSLNGSSTATSTFQINTGLVSGKLYEVVYTISNYVGGSVRIELGSANVSVGTTRSANGTYTEYIEALGDDQLIFDGIVSFTGSIDNISVKEVQGFTSPDGTNNAYKLVEDTGTTHGMYNSSNSFSSVSNGSYSIFVKYNGRQWVRLYCQFGTTSFNSWFDILNGVTGTSSADESDIEDYGNGWFKITQTNSLDTINGRYRLYLADEDNSTSYTGDGVSGAYIWGAQSEEGSYATSYIPTSGIAVTRLADACSQTPPDGVIGQTEGTMYVEIGRKITSSIDLFECGQGSSQHRFFVYTDASSKLKVLVVNNYTVQVNYTSTVNVDSNAKIAIGYANNNYAIYLNGSLLTTDTSATVPPMNQIAIASDRGTIVTASNQIKETKLYNTRLSNSELAALTS